jgi:predicted small secreted protein
MLPPVPVVVVCIVAPIDDGGCERNREALRQFRAPGLAGHEHPDMPRTPELPVVRTAVLSLALGLVACNTIEGAGKDVSAAGRAVSDTAKETKQTY